MAILVAYRPFQGLLPKPKSLPEGAARAFVAWAIFFSLTVVGWILFRARSGEQISWFLTHIWDFSRSAQTLRWTKELLVFTAPLGLMQIVQYWRHDLLAAAKGPLVVRGALYAGMLGAILLYGAQESIEFIYFQF